MKVMVLSTLLLLAALSPASAMSVLASDEAMLAKPNRPVTKVITLLKDMMRQLEKEAEEDQAIYEKMECWCTTNDKEKTAAIAEAEAKIESLQNKIEELTATSARLTQEITNLEQEVEKDKQALATATALREKQLAEFNAEEKNLLESIAALKEAIEVLSKHHRPKASEAFLQEDGRQAISGVAATVQKAMQQHASLLQGVLTPSARRAVAAFIQQPTDYFGATPTFKQAYAPQSGEIFGVLTQMKETFEANLSEAQRDETEAQKSYEDLKAAKEREIKAGLDQIDTKEEELAATDEKNAQAKEDLKDTMASLSADQQYLVKLKEQCAMTDREWEQRQNTRNLEMEAVSKALAVLSSDDAHDLFTRTFNPVAGETAGRNPESFAQEGAEVSSERRTEASKLLKAVAEKLNSPRLATLAVKVRLDAFTRVKKAIDDMIMQLTQEKADEIKHKDFCVEELNSNELQTDKKHREKKDLEALIEDLEMAIEKLTREIDQLKAEIAEMQVQMKRAGEDRTKESAEFQKTVADQRETQKLLQAALQILNSFYAREGKKAALLQGRQEPAGPPPPPGFENYKKNEAAPGVMGMIQQIVADAKAMELEAIKSEQDAQKAYETYIKETNASIQAKSKEIVAKSNIKAKKEEDLVQANQDKAEVEKEIEHLENYRKELKESCDFTLKNFEIRQTARDEEIEALKQAKAILSGAKFEAFLQGA